MTRTFALLPAAGHTAAGLGSALVQQSLRALFPHGLQHRSRRNEQVAVGLAAAGRRDRERAATVLASAPGPPARAAARS